MQLAQRRWSEIYAPMVRMWWSVHRAVVLRVVVGVMAGVASAWLAYQFWRVLWQATPIWHSSPEGAVDLKLRYEQVRGWFRGRPLYREMRDALDPPATDLMLWPLLGWLEFASALWLWLVITVASLAWLVYLIAQESGADTRVERTFVSLMPFSMYATGAGIGNGQLAAIVVPMLLAGLLALPKGRGWRHDLLAAMLLLISLAKPSATVPFFWIVCFATGRLRPALLVVLGYVALTLGAASFQHDSLPTLLREYLANTSWTAGAGNAHLQLWLVDLGLGKWGWAASLLVLAALGLWTYRHRRGDLWVLMSIAAMVARFWMYHRWYDDLLMLIPMVTLFRLAKQPPACGTDDVVAGVLLAMALLSMLAPGGLYLLPWPWNSLYSVGQGTVWLAVFVFLSIQAERQRCAVYV